MKHPNTILILCMVSYRSPHHLLTNSVCNPIPISNWSLGHFAWSMSDCVRHKSSGCTRLCLSVYLSVSRSCVAAMQLQNTTVKKSVFCSFIQLCMKHNHTTACWWRLQEGAFLSRRCLVASDRRCQRRRSSFSSSCLVPSSVFENICRSVLYAFKKTHAQAMSVNTCWSMM